MRSLLEWVLLRYEVRFKGQDRTALDKWLLLEASDGYSFFISQVGAFPDVYENLAGL